MPSKLILYFMAGLSAITAIFFEITENFTLFSVFKPLTTILIILIPIYYGSRENKRYLWLSIFALIFCLAGDIFLLWESYFVWGLAAFLIAHILLIFSFAAIDGLKFYPVPLIILVVFGITYYSLLYHHLETLAIPVFLYFVFIIIMCWQGVNLYLWRSEKIYACIALAVILFLFSDSIIAFNKFLYPFTLSRIIILSSYWLSILLLAHATTMRQARSEA